MHKTKKKNELMFKLDEFEIHNKLMAVGLVKQKWNLAYFLDNAFPLLLSSVFVSWARKK